jgi:GntR family transcriptional regulator / MocR family aminotransferase
MPASRRVTKAMKKVNAAIHPYFPFERRSNIPFYKQIYDGYREAILGGRLRPGQRLQSTRALATELRISRLPVVIAYEQLLHEGYIEGKIGAGTYVKHSIPDELTQVTRHRKIEQCESPVGAEEFKNLLGPFRVSLPALDHFPMKIWSRLVSHHSRNFSVENMAYGDPAGHFPLREAIAEYLRTARAVKCEANQILIVSGSQLALQICARTLLTSSDSVCIEDPGYPGARDALKASGAVLVPIPVDEEGISIQKLSSSGKKVRAVYVTPSHQYPLGTLMSASRRLQLLDWAGENRAWIIEDDYDSEYRYASRPLGSLQGMDNSSRVIYIGTFSKVLFPSVRVGYIVVPSELIKEFTQIRESIDIFSPILYQLVLTDFLQEGHFARHLRRMRTIYLERRNVLVSSVQKHFGNLLTPFNTDGGLHLCAFLPKGIDDREITRNAAQRGISVMPLSSCYADKKSKSGLVLGFAGANESQIEAATKILRQIIGRA